MSINADHLLRTACQTVAAHGDNAFQFALSRAAALHGTSAASEWEHVSNVITAIFDDGFSPAD